MVLGEVSLGRVEQLLLRATPQLRPTLAEGDPAVLFVDRMHPFSVRRPGRAVFSDRPAHGSVRRSTPSPDPWPAAPRWATENHCRTRPLAIRFHNVAGARALS